jgi:hypothetical protein
LKQTNLNKITRRIIEPPQNPKTATHIHQTTHTHEMACIDDDWENFLTQGTIILSDEKKTAKKNINKVYSENDKISQSMNSMNGINGMNKKAMNMVNSMSAPTPAADMPVSSPTPKTSPATAPALIRKPRAMKGNVCEDDCDDSSDDIDAVDDDIGDDIGDDDIDSALISDHENDNDNDNDNILASETLLDGDIRKPKCSNIYISTKTKISYLNMPIDIKRVFWNIPISPYSTPSECIIKKQIKVSTTDPAELKEIKELLTKEKYYQEQEIEHIDNPEGRIKFKVQLKINVGLCKKDILNYRCKLKRAFFNCFVLIMRIKDRATDSFKEMHLKVFNTGKLEIPGIQTDESLTQVLDLLISILKPIVGDSVGYIPDKCETVLINSNFNCGYFINRDKLYNILKYKYRINSNYDACSYPGIQSKFYYVTKLGIENQTGQQPAPADAGDAIEISFMIFRTGSVLIVGRCDEYVLHSIYNFLKKLLEIEYPEIGNKLNIIEPKKNNVKLRRKIINVVENI